jgi:hypothetical protein
MSGVWKVEGRSGIWLVRGSASAASLLTRGVTLGRDAAAARVSEWFPEGWGHEQNRTLAAICHALEGAFPDSGPPEGWWLRKTVQKALRDGRLTALRVDLPAPVWGVEEEEPVTAKRPAAVVEQKTWIEIVLLDDDDPPQPMAFATYRIELPNGSPREGVLDANGRARIDGIDPGECLVTFPDLDTEAWYRDGKPPVQAAPASKGPAQAAGATALGSTHVVIQGDCMNSIAADHGFFWRTLWDHPANAAIVGKRKDPNILLRGDRVHIPEKRRRMEECPTTRVHRFRVRNVPAKLNLRLLTEDGDPRSGLEYVVTIDGHTRKGTTDAEGYMRLSIPPNAREGTLLLPESEEEYELSLGHIDPITEVSGVQARLSNLGYYFGEVSGAMDPKTRGALWRFQSNAGMNPTGELDDETRAALQQAYGA